MLSNPLLAGPHEILPGGKIHLPLVLVQLTLLAGSNISWDNPWPAAVSYTVIFHAPNVAALGRTAGIHCRLWMCFCRTSKERAKTIETANQ